MKDFTEIIAEIEERLNVKLKRTEKGVEMTGNSYYISTSYNADQSIRYDKVEKICLSKMHLKDFSAFQSTYKTIRYLTLIDCIVEDLWELHDFEKLDHLTLNKCSIAIDSTVDRTSDFYLSGLDLYHMNSADLAVLSKVFYSVHYLSFNHSAFDSISDFLSFEFLISLSLDHVTLSSEGDFDPNASLAETSHRHFQSLYLENMDIPHPGYFLPISKHLEYIYFTNCKVSNLYEVNLFDYLYSLTIETTEFVVSGNENKYLPKPDRRFTFLNFEDMKLTDFEYFEPISDDLRVVGFYNVEVDDLDGITRFSALEEIRIHPNFEVKNTITSKDKLVSSFELENCIIGPRTTTYDWDDVALAPDFDLENVKTIAPYIRRLTIQGYNLVNESHLEYFTRLEELSFEKCIVDLNSFAAIAPQIKKITFDTTTIKNQESFRHFKNLEHLEVFSYDDDIGHVDLKHLLPLKDTLRKFDPFYWMLQNIQELGHFTALEELEASVSSVELAQNLLSISSFRKLELDVDDVEPVPEGKIILNLQQLKNVEHLSLRAQEGIKFTGIGHLKKLTSLDASFDFDIENLDQLPSLEKLEMSGEDLLKVPRLERLKVLDLTIDKACEIASLENFPNLEKLKISIAYDAKICFGRLEHLKILILDHGDLESIVSFENLPQLEELDLEYGNVESLAKLSCLDHLKVLNLSENELKNIEGIQHLKSLERLNLYHNKIADVRLLNELSHLQEVNLAATDLRKEDAQQQLDKPEIAEWFGRPYIPFSIRID